MKNKMADVRDHLVQALEDLSNREATAEEIARTIERAKTISTVAGMYVQAVKVEIDAIRVASETGHLASSVEPGQRMLEGRR
jgi:phosphopantetheine adenylyltransferase